MIIENNCSVKKDALRIVISEYNFQTKEKKSTYLNPSELDSLVLTRPSTISSSIFTLAPNLNIVFFNKGFPTNMIIPADNLPKILSNDSLFFKLSPYKKRKLRYIFCKAVCSNRIKVISRMNEIRKDKIIDEVLIEMREIESKLIDAKTREEIMGYEGNIAKNFYFALSEFNPLFDINRNRNSVDIVNVLMNFCHTILRNRIYSRLLLNNLNPYHSFLHDNHRNQPYLAFDFTEFWIAYVDKLIFYMIDKGILKQKDVNDDGRLSQYAIRRCVQLVNSRIKNEEIDKKIKDFVGFLEGKKRFTWVA